MLKISKSFLFDRSILNSQSSFHSSDEVARNYVINTPESARFCSYGYILSLTRSLPFLPISCCGMTVDREANDACFY